MFVKLPRKNLLSMLESEQVKLTGLIDKARDSLKSKVRELNGLVGEDMLGRGEMDPYVLKLLIQERKTGKVIEEEENEESD